MQEQLTIREQREGMDVDKLRAENASESWVLVPAGLVLEGGYQDRMVCASMLIPPHTRVDLPTRCVERGRRRGPSPVFSVSDPMKIFPPTILYGNTHTDQHGTWHTIGNLADETQCESVSRSLGHVYTHVHRNLEEMTQGFPRVLPQRTVGVAFALLRPTPPHVSHLMIDVFAEPRLCRAFYPALLRSAALPMLSAEAVPSSPPLKDEVKSVLAWFIEQMKKATYNYELQPEDEEGEPWITRRTATIHDPHRRATVTLLEHDNTLVHLAARMMPA